MLASRPISHSCKSPLNNVPVALESICVVKSPSVCNSLPLPNKSLPKPLKRYVPNKSTRGNNKFLLASNSSSRRFNRQRCRRISARRLKAFSRIFCQLKTDSTSLGTSTGSTNRLSFNGIPVIKRNRRSAVRTPPVRRNVPLELPLLVRVPSFNRP